MENFEYLLTKEIVNSLTNHPEKWKLSICGIKRDDGLDLLISSFKSVGNTYVYGPKKYEFKDEKNKKLVFDAAWNLKERKEEEKRKAEFTDNEKELSEFLHLDTRKNKLDYLDKLSQSNSAADIKVEVELKLPEKEKDTFYTKLKNIFK